MGLRFHSQSPPVSWRPNPTYGRGLLTRDTSSRWLSNAIVFTAPEPWALVASLFPGHETRDDLSGRRVHVTTMDHDTLRSQIKAAVDAGGGESMITGVFGVGGGSACDAAKYAAGVVAERCVGGPPPPLVLVPTILSVDAPFTRAAGVRETGKVMSVPV